MIWWWTQCFPIVTSRTSKLDSPFIPAAPLRRAMLSINPATVDVDDVFRGWQWRCCGVGDRSAMSNERRRTSAFAFLLAVVRHSPLSSRETDTLTQNRAPTEIVVSSWESRDVIASLLWDHETQFHGNTVRMIGWEHLDVRAISITVCMILRFE